MANIMYYSRLERFEYEEWVPTMVNIPLSMVYNSGSKTALLVIERSPHSGLWANIDILHLE